MGSEGGNMKEEFKINLQLFADGEGVDTGEQPVVDSQPDDIPDFGIDEDGNAVFFNGGSMDDDQNQEEPNTPESDDSKSVQSAPTEPETYVVKVNGEEQEVSLDELLHGYMRNQDYTRKTQQLADERRQMQMYTPQPQVQPQAQTQQPQEPTPSEPQFTQKTYYEKLAEYAKAEVENTFGEEFDEYNTMHQAAFADSIATVKAQVWQQQQEEAQRQAVVDNFNKTMYKYTQDPNYREIDAYALQKLNELPYAQAIQIKQALDNYDANVVDQYMTAVRNEFYGVRNVPTISKKNIVTQQRGPKPPYVEPAGAATTQPGNPTREIDYSKLRNLNIDEQAKLLAQMNYFEK